MSSLIGSLFSDGKIYLVIYGLLYLFIVLDFAKEIQHARKVILCFFFLVFVLFNGLRWETGTDWDAYKGLFDTIEFNWTFLLNVYGFDLGYVFLNAVVKLFTNSYTLFLIIDNIITFSLLFRFLNKYSSAPFISLFLFYNSFFISHFMGSNRRMIALCLVLFLFLKIYEGKKKSAAWYHFLAFSFHRTSIITVVAWFVPKKRFSFQKVLTLLSVSFAIGIFQLPFKLIEAFGGYLAAFSANPLIDKLIFYSENSDSITPENVNPVIQVTLAIIKRSIFLAFYFLVIASAKKRLDPITDFFFNVYIIGFCGYILFNGSPIFQVLSNYFTFVEIVLIGRIWYYALYNQKIAFASFLFLYGFVQILSALNAYPELYIPYKSVLFK